jgi:hypothetical protein
MNTLIRIPGMDVIDSVMYVGRVECRFWGTRGRQIKYWVTETFGNDDMIYCTDRNMTSLLAKQQLTMLLLRWA